MTYQNLTLEHDDNAEEVSPLLLTVAGGGVPAGKKKNGVPTMRAMLVTTCFILGTLAVIYYGRGSSSTTSSGGISAALLQGYNPDGYDPDGYDPDSDYCFTDTDTPGNYCWFPNLEFPCTEQNNWRLDFSTCPKFSPKCITY